MSMTPEQATWFADVAGRIVTNVEQVLLGKTFVIRLAVTAMLSEGHLLLEDVPGDRVTTGLTPTWELLYGLAGANQTRRDAQAGEVARFTTEKPFLASDVYEFTVTGARFDAAAAAGLLDEVRVVPNPYRGVSAFEQANPFPTGRGERVIRFINVGNNPPS